MRWTTNDTPRDVQEERCVISSILIIDDDPQIRAFLRRALEAGGYEVRQASNGQDGLRMLQKVSVDLVITDVLMPDMDGLEVTSALHRQFPTLPVIAVTGGTPEFDYLDVARALGAHRTLRKPFTITELLDTVRQELGNDPRQERRKDPRLKVT